LLKYKNTNKITGSVF